MRIERVGGGGPSDIVGCSPGTLPGEIDEVRGGGWVWTIT